MTVKKLTIGAAIAAIYATLTIFLSPISYGPVQCRISEALCILPAFTPVAVWGLFVGCLIANIFTGSLIDVVLGSLTTLLAAVLTYKTRKNIYVAMLFPVILNALVVGSYLAVLYEGVPVLLSILYVGVGQAVSCYGLGLPLYKLLKKKNIKFEKH